eukprot:CAMPEP_0196654824 /NCGR_PEP_ID=MMETSP1086-20130531/4548_1 /TAXON_ID=77921 /ORGANISM="Cyanoptyche  gloeocystis , Strain SAG4.97" /LENGTH=300 /DNA_ID=CAMNT_0041986797 /DNA_START=88 /DNA_END=990 /DNA_ORIENTATION=-
MSAPIYRKVLIAGGSGGLGLKISQAFLAKKNDFEVSILTRKAEKPKPEIETLKSSGATIVEYTSESVDELSSLLKGSEVVVSALGAAALYPFQVTLVEAAKNAGVKHFIPSEFGVASLDKDFKDIALFTGKFATFDAIKKAGLDWTLIYTGYFVDTTFEAWIGFDWRNGKVLVPGDGSLKNSWTHRDDVAKVVVNSLYWPGSKNGVIRISGSDLTYNEIVALFEAALGKKLEVSYKSAEKFAEEIKAYPNPYASWLEQLQLILAQGRGLVGPPLNNTELGLSAPIKAADFISAVVKSASG